MLLQLFPEKEGVSWLKFYTLSCFTRYQVFHFQVTSVDFTGGSILLMDHWHTALMCPAGQVNKKKHPTPATLCQSDGWGDPWIQRTLFSHEWGFGSHLLTKPHCSFFISNCIIYWLPAKYDQRKW